jgi:5-(carboxyamino)imidazole ribonucleotide mutase
MHRSDHAPQLRALADRQAPRLGIIGGGQLAKMTAAAATPFGCEVVVLERQDEFPAHSVDTHALIGDWNDPRELLRFAPLVDLVTMEMVASYTTMPVIGVPIESKALRGLDSLLLIVQMPGGVPVAMVAIGNAKNAGLLAAIILAAGGDTRLSKRLRAYKARMARQSREKNRHL